MLKMRLKFGSFSSSSKRSLSTSFRNCQRKEVRYPPIQKAKQQNKNIDSAIPGASHDCIGPPNKFSNIRPIKFYVPTNETPLQLQLRKHREETQEWNDEFWKNHNIKFKKMKADFIKKRLEEKYANTVEDQKRLTADEMSEFYKAFLDLHRTQHIEYNKEWYKRNFRILYLSAYVRLQSFLKLFKT
ncbi:cytochrome c oxidase assembly factor 8 isoform X2 [Oratosquilla oratoria]